MRGGKGRERERERERDCYLKMYRIVEIQSLIIQQSHTA
jgi:hypothetical protein